MGKEAINPAMMMRAAETPVKRFRLESTYGNVLRNTDKLIAKKFEQSIYRVSKKMFLTLCSLIMEKNILGHSLYTIDCSYFRCKYHNN